jgi:uncharacterized protein YcfL
MRFQSTLAGIALALAGVAAQAQTPPEPNSAASKLMLRGKPYGVQVVDMRAQKRNDVLVVQTELVNTEKGDRQVYWRYRWLDASGMQVGDGDAWKPLLMYGLQSQFVRGTAPTGQVVDFRLEMNTEKL